MSTTPRLRRKSLTMSSSFDNAVIIRRTREKILKGIYDDEIREDRGEETLKILILAKGDGVKVEEIRRNLSKYGLDLDMEVLPCG